MSGPPDAPEQRPAPRKARAAAALVGAGALLLVYGDVLLGRAFVYSDALLVHWPAKARFVDRLLAGELPEWYPFDGLGTSYLGAGATGLLHPFVALHLLLPHGLALSLGLVLAHAFAIAGTFKLLRRWRCDEAAALAGALAFGLSGYLLSMDGRPSYALAAAFVPWAALGLEAGSVAVCAASMALVVLSGERLHTLLFASVLLAALALTHPRRGRALATLAASGGVALLASAAQWLPSVLSLEGPAGAGPEANRWSFNPLRLLELLAPGIVELPGGRAPVELYSLQAFGSCWAPGVFLGATVLALAAAGLGSSPDRRLRFVLGGSAVVALLASLGQGERAPVFQALRLVPGFSLLRYPERGILFVAWPIACLAGLGMQAVLAGADARARRTMARALGALVALQLALAVALPGLEPVALALAGARTEAARLEFAGLVSPLRWGLLWGALLALPSGHLALDLRWRGRVPVALASVLLPLLAAAQPFSAWRADPSRLLPRPTTGAAIAAAPDGPAYGRSRVYAYYSAVQPECSAGPLCSDVPLSFRTLPFFGLENSLGYLPTTNLGRVAAAEERLPSLVFFRGFNVRYAVPPNERIAREADARGLIEDPGAGDRIRLVRGLPVGSMEEALQLAGAPGFDPVSSVPVEAGGAEHPATAPMSPRVRVERYSPERIEVEASSGSPCTLFVADAFAPGWTAKVDGKSAPILPGLVAGRAVAVPAGTHRVEMAYRTPGLATGLVLSLLGWLSVFGLAFIPRARAGAGAPPGTPASP